jgi:hypothetical protein
MLGSALTIRELLRFWLKYCVVSVLIVVGIAAVSMDFCQFKRMAFTPVNISGNGVTGC